MHKIVFKSLLAALTISLSSLSAQAAYDPFLGSDLQLLSFQVSSVAFRQDTRMQYTGGIAWTPAYAITDSFRLKGYLGGVPIKREPDGHLSPVLEASIWTTLLALAPDFLIDAGGGLQFWPSTDTLAHSSTDPTMGLGARLYFDEAVGGLFSGLVFRYNVVLKSELTTHQGSVGLTLDF